MTEKKPEVPGRLWPVDLPFNTIVRGRDDTAFVRNGFECTLRAGDFQFLDADDKSTRDPDKVRRLSFYCPVKETGAARPRYCGAISVLQADIPPGKRVWAWDGNFEKPTLKPSINCQGCWHGFLVKGVYKTA